MKPESDSATKLQMIQAKCEQIENEIINQEVTPALVKEYLYIVHTIISCESKDRQFFEFFAKKNLMDFFLFFFNKKLEEGLFVLLLQSYSQLLSNVKQPPFLNYIFSHPVFNKILEIEFNFKNEDIQFYFVSLIKSIS